MSKSLRRLRLQSSLDDLKSGRFWCAVFAECLGTLLLVFVGCGSTFQNTKHLDIALAFGLSVATIVWAIADISGGHINPAVSLAMLFTRNISLLKAILYIIAQMGGALLGALILKVVANLPAGGTGINLPSSATSDGQAVGVEIIVTFVLVLTVFGSCDSKRSMSGSAPLAIGLSVVVCHTSFIKLTGCSMNPARSFGPAVIYGNTSKHWIFWAGPCAGGVLAGFIYEFMFAVDASPRRIAAMFFDPLYNTNTNGAANNYENKNDDLTNQN